MRVSNEVVAIIVTNGETAYLSRTLNEVLTSSTIPKNIFLVDVSENSISQHNEISIGHETSNIYFVAAPEANGFSEAVAKARNEAYFPNNTKWIWFLHDDSRPETETLEHLLKATKNQQSTAFFGAKQIRWTLDEESNELINVGWSLLSNGERFSNVHPGEIDQQQHDFDDDVFAVSLTGALVKQQVFDEIGGLDKGYRKYGLSEDFAYRVWLSENRVRIVSKAVIRHAQGDLEVQRDYGAEGKTAAAVVLSNLADVATDKTVLMKAINPDKELILQNSESLTKQKNLDRVELGKLDGKLRYQLCTTSSLKVPLILLFSIFASPFKAIYHLGHKNIALAKGEILIPFLMLFKLAAIHKHRKLIKEHSVIDPKTLKALNPSKERIKEFYEEKKVFEQSKDDIFLLSDKEAAKLVDIIKKRRKAFAITISLLIVFSAAYFYFFRVQLFSGITDLANAKLDSYANFGDLFNAATAHFIQGGTGIIEAPNPLLTVFLPITFILGFSVHNALLFILLTGFGLAGLSMWSATGVFTRNNPLRAISSLIYAFSPFLVYAYSHNLINGILAYIAFPLVIYGYGRAFGEKTYPLSDFSIVTNARGMDSKSKDFMKTKLGSFSGSALALAFFTAAAPLFLIPASLIVMILGVLKKNLKKALVSLAPAFLVNIFVIYDLLRNVEIFNFQGFINFSNSIALFSIIITCLLIWVSAKIKTKSLSKFLGVFLVLPAVIFAGYGFFQQTTNLTEEDKQSPELPLIAQRLQETESNPRILAITPIASNNLQYEVLRYKNADFIDKNPKFIVRPENEKSLNFDKIVGILVAGRSEDDDNIPISVKLSENGIAGVALFNTSAESEYYSLLATIETEENLNRIIMQDNVQFWKVESENPIIWDNSQLENAFQNPFRIGFVALFLIIILGYILVSIPFSNKRRVISQITSDQIETPLTKELNEDENG